MPMTTSETPRLATSRKAHTVTANQMQRLTPERLGDILATEPKAVALFDDDMRVTGVELPLPDGMTYADGSQTMTALFGDRVGKDRYGQWLVYRRTP